MDKNIDLSTQLEKQEKLFDIVNKMNAAESRDQIILTLKNELLEVFDAEHVLMFLKDKDWNKLYSKFQSENWTQEKKQYIDNSNIEWFVFNSKEIINIKDLQELRSIIPYIDLYNLFQKKIWIDVKQLIATPIIFDQNEKDDVFGVIELINKNLKEGFQKEDESNIHKLWRALWIVFKNFKKRSPTPYNYLVINNLITWNDLESIMKQIENTHEDAEEILLYKYKIPKDKILKSYEYYYKLNTVTYDENTEMPRQISEKLNINYLKREVWVPVDYYDWILTIAVNNYNILQIEDIRNIFQNDPSVKKIQFKIWIKEDILEYIKLLQSPTSKKKSLEHTIWELSKDSATEDSEKEVEEKRVDDIRETDSAIIRLVNQIVSIWCEKWASDIHIEPDKEKKLVNIRYRVDWICIKEKTFPYSNLQAVISRIKIMADMDIAEKRKPQDGKINVGYLWENIDLRIATIPTIDWESCVIRLLSSNKLFKFNELNLSTKNEYDFKEILNMPYWLILVVWPTGSGKTTTLHAALNQLNTAEKKIWTAEDPVEISQSWLNQVQVNSNIWFDFSDAMRTFLRADPDIIMVGEMRDKETAKMWIEASLTGHLVISTLHTNSAPETVVRLIDLWIDPFNLTDSFLWVLAQRLVRTLCSQCKEPYQPSQEEFNELLLSYGEKYFTDLGIKYSKDLILYKAVGCKDCNELWYKWRTWIHELLIWTENVKKLIQNQATASQIRNQAMEDWMRTLFQDWIEKIFKWQTDKKQLNLVCYNYPSTE